MTENRARRGLLHRTMAVGAAALLAGFAVHSTTGSVLAAPRPHAMAIRPSSEIGPATGLPTPGNMVYGGGHVQVAPRIYLIFWGWHGSNANVSTLMTNFVKAIGGTPWAGIQTQYYETVNGQQINITNPANQFGGVWFDDTNPIHDNLSDLEIAQEAQQGVAHFAGADLSNSNFVVATPQNANNAAFNAGSYCAWHNWSANISGLNAPQPFSFTNEPYLPNAGANCGADSVNPAPQGDLDGVTIVLGHELEETVTNPGAWNAQDTGWGDQTGEENGDKCAWVGGSLLSNPLTGQATAVPGAITNLQLNDGRSYPVQSLWSNRANSGTGYCTTS